MATRDKQEQDSARQPRCAATNLPIVEEDGASHEVTALYQQYRAHFDRTDVPGIVRCFATHPPLLRAMLDLASGMLFAEGALTRRHKEMLAAFVSFRNACSYCADSHGYFFRQLGGTNAALFALRESQLSSEELTGAERALLEFAEKVNRESQLLRRDDVDAAVRAGWSELQIAETVHTVALFAAFNRIANAFGLPSQGLLSDSDPELKP